MTQQQTDWVTIAEAATLLGIGERTVWRRIKSAGSDKLTTCHRVDGGHRVTLVQLAAPATAAKAAVAYQEHRTALEVTTSALVAAAQANVDQARQEVRHYKRLGTWAASAAACLAVTTALLYGTSRAQTAVADELRVRVAGIEQDKQRLVGQLDALQATATQAQNDRADASVNALVELLGGTPLARADVCD